MVTSKIDKPIQKSKLFYCKKGDKLKVISDFENVWIVELKGDRFSMNKNDVQT